MRNKVRLNDLNQKNLQSMQKLKHQYFKKDGGSAAVDAGADVNDIADQEYAASVQQRK